MNSMYEILSKFKEVGTGKTLTEAKVAEKIEPPIKTDPAERGKYKGKDVADLKKMKASHLKHTAAVKEKGKKVSAADKEKTAEINFALRAKQAKGGKWGKIKESTMTESALDMILQRHSRDFDAFKQGDDLSDSLYNSLYDYYFDEMPYGVKKARTGDPYEWISQRLHDEMGLGEGNFFAHNVLKAKQQGLKKADLDGDGDMEPVREAGKPMTSKQQSFAKLAPPRDKITFADKIAGAKQEVDEMLGDVAAEAMKNAVGKMGARSHQAKTTMKHVNASGASAKEKAAIGKAAKDIKPGIAGYRDREAALKAAGVVDDRGPQRESRDDDDDDYYGTKQSHKTASGGTVTRHGGVTKHQAAPGRYGGYNPETDPDKDDDKPETPAGEKRGRGRPKGTGGPRQERVTAKSRKQDRTAHGQSGFKKAANKKKVKEDERSKYHNDLDQTSLHWSKEVRDLEDPQGKATKYVPNRDQYRVHTGAVAPDAVKDRIKRRQTKGGPAGPKWGQMLPREGVEENDFVPGHDQGEYDREGEMAKQDLKTAKSAAAELRSILDSDENLPEWVQSKITKAVDYLDTARDYMKSKDDDAEPVAEKAVSKKQQKFMGMVHAAQKGEKPASKEVAKVAKTMKKSDAKDFAATKHKGLPEKKKKEVEETTVAGSVAPGAEPAADSGAPKEKKAKGGMIFGKGVYEGKLQESYNSQLKKILNEGMSVNVSVGEDGTKTLNINATDEDAEKLAEILKLAGMGSSEAMHSETCPACGQADCGCDTVEEDYANSPDQVYGTTEMINSQGEDLNKPKSTGQTTIPVVNRDPRRGSIGPMAEAKEDRLWNLYKRFSA